MTELHPPLRVVVVDDSAYNRQAISNILQSLPGIEVVGRAVNGKEALQLAFDLEPDAITLDLEMPEMDGFSFLRLLMDRRPTPVIVVSGYSQRENVFRALELGALDFIAKPSRTISPEIHNIEEDLQRKIQLVRKLQAVRLRERARSLARAGGAAPPPRPAAPAVEEPAPDLHGLPAARCVVGIAASTGGPPAVQQVLARLTRDLPVAVVVAQHMPPRFTRAFADRLDRLLDLRVLEASDGLPVRAGVVYVAPGGHHAKIVREDGVARVRVVPRVGASGLAPSGDQLLESLAHTYGDRACALVLTGMGADGSVGVEAVARAGGQVLAEDPNTAIMPGMPASAIETGHVRRVLPVERLGEALVAFAQGCAPD